jgi:hypothetical protein
MDFLAGLGIGLAAAGIAALMLVFRGRRVKSMVVVGQGGLDGLRRVGELVVLRAMWSLPATGEDHIFGEIGHRFLRWLWSENKTIMIFRFEIRFKYNLSDPQSVELTRLSSDVLEVRLGKAHHEIALADVQFYHTARGQLLDWLLPRVLNIFRSDMDDKTRQAILEAAQRNARAEAEQLASQFAGEARVSAEAALVALGRSAGFSEIRFAGDGPAIPRPLAADKA